jgi:prepilin-type N-terminal cleavage/methylation domain-containing protein
MTNRNTIALSRFVPMRSARRGAFTLIELLIVIAIIGLLAAILFPAFKRAQEGGYQANCASNLKQIYQAVELYRQDEKIYPASLAVLLPKESAIANPNGATTYIPMPRPGTPLPERDCDPGALTCSNPEGTGFFKGGKDGLICADDDSDPTYIRSSYGDISTDISTAMTGTDTSDMGRYVWNYWGYRATDDTANCTATNVSGCAGTAYQTASLALTAVTTSGFDNQLLYNPSAPPTTLPELEKNPLKYSLANRFAPTSTIITHCVYHRLPTASGKIFAPYEIYTDPSNGSLARDIVLRRDGSAKVLDVSRFNTNNNWAKQNF